MINHSSRSAACLAVFLPLLLLLQAGCAAPAPTTAVKLEHHDPAYLNEAAAAALSAGDRGTARILLERAAVLAPSNETIRNNLAALRQASTSNTVVETVGRIASEVSRKPNPGTAANPIQADMVEPAIWPMQ